MLCIVSPNHNPAFNLAAEEYLFKNYTEDVFFLYVNAPSVVVGKHQNAMAEVNSRFIRENNIPLIRRLSGGGAVYHDLGNLNFSFHQTVDDTAKISFKAFNEPIVEVLHQLSVPAEISSRNDIFVDGSKVSGHAEHVFRKRILSHGTLLFNANRENLSKALKSESGTYSGKAIQSVRSKVANLTDFMKNPMEMNEFVELVAAHILTKKSNNKLFQWTKADQQNIHQLADEKYSTWDWNFAYSPKYWFEKQTEMDGKILAIKMFVEKGHISELELNGELLCKEQQLKLKATLLNQTHEFVAIQKLLAELNIPEQINDCFF